MGGALWEGSCERDLVEGALWEEPCGRGVSRKRALRGKSFLRKGACRSPNLGNGTTPGTSRVDNKQILESHRCGFELWLCYPPPYDLEHMASLP